jgi:hypothetical protein
MIPSFDARGRKLEDRPRKCQAACNDRESSLTQPYLGGVKIKYKDREQHQDPANRHHGRAVFLLLFRR